MMIDSEINRRANRPKSAAIRYPRHGTSAGEIGTRSPIRRINANDDTLLPGHPGRPCTVAVPSARSTAGLRSIDIRHKNASMSRTKSRSGQEKHIYTLI